MHHDRSRTLRHTITVRGAQATLDIEMLISTRLLLQANSGGGKSHPSQDDRGSILTCAAQQASERIARGHQGMMDHITGTGSKA